jgi:hypothetical protein
MKSIALVTTKTLFGVITYLALYLQVVKGNSPTSSGLTLVPLMAELLVTSILSGQLISRYGHYKPFPIAGTAIMVVDVFLLFRPVRPSRTSRSRPRQSRQGGQSPH